MTPPPWSPFPPQHCLTLDTEEMRARWPRLHAGDALTFPEDPAVQAAWQLYHQGQLEAAHAAGLQAGDGGLTVAYRAMAIYANYLEPREGRRMAFFHDVSEQAQAWAEDCPEEPSAWFWQAYALGRYSLGISVSKAMAQGLDVQIRQALEKTIALCPQHADAHLSLGLFHAEVIDKVGPLVGEVACGAKKEVSLAMFERGLALNPRSIAGKIAYASALLMLDGPTRMDEANALYEQAAATEPLDALEHLQVEIAQSELAAA